MKRAVLIAFIVAFIVMMGLAVVGLVTSNPGAHINTDVPDTPTYPPTPSPTPKPTMQQKIQQLVSDAGLSTITSVKFDASTRAVIIDSTVHEEFDNSAYRDVGRLTIFEIQEALWKSDVHPSEVTVRILGPLLDRYGNPSTGVYMWATLKSPTARLFNWDNLGQDSAWNDYDDTWELPSLSK